MNTDLENSPPPLPVHALLILVLSLFAAWLAAGSLGWLAPPLQKALTWLAFATIVVAALADHRRMNRQKGLVLGGATLLAVLMTASSLPVVNLCGVALLLAAIAQVRPGTIAVVCGPAALAAMALAVYRLLCDSSATVWTFANTVGRLEGLWAGWLTGRPLLIGASFGGLDFLVLMAALTTAWLMATPRPRLGRAAWAVLFIILAQNAYLVLLAFSVDLSGLLPPQVKSSFTNVSHLGIWTWGNALRALLPWNLPLLAALLHGMVAAGMFRLTAWPMTLHDLQSESDDPSAAVADKPRNRSLQGDPARPYNAKNWQRNWQCFAPSGLFIVAVAALTFTPLQPDLKGRRIVAYDDGATDWGIADPGDVPPGKRPRYGLLPALVESLGGELIRSRDLAATDLSAADVLIVLPSRAAIADDLQSRIWRYVAAGGRMIVAGDPETTLGVQEDVLNALLRPTAMSFRDDTANSLTERWEYNLQSAPHAATASSNPGQNHFSFDRAASIRVSWPAGPLVAGRWGWDEVGTDPDRPEPLAYTPGNHLGDLVLAAQQNIGQGTVVVLGAAACLSNDGIPFSYTFTGPLLSALAANQPTPLVWWRQLLGVAAAGAAIVVLFRRIDMAGVAVAAVAVTLTLLACRQFNNVAAQLLPSGTSAAAQPVIYVDGSHLEGMGKDPWGENGIGRFMRVLAGNGYLPLVAPDVSLERLKKAAMLISIAPGKAFGSGEIAAVDQFVKEGGFLLSMVGSPDAGPSQALLQSCGLVVPPVPVPPWVNQLETTPDGNFQYPRGQSAMVEFYASWPAFSTQGGELWPKDEPDKRPVIAGNRIGQGQAFVIGDSAFALKKNFELFAPNPDFWRSQLQTWLGHSAERPRPVAPNTVTPNTGTPNTGAIINLPKPAADQGATP